MVLENINHDTCHVTISRGPCSPCMPTPLFGSSCFLPQPQQPFPPSQQSHTDNCFSLCETKGWKRGWWGEDKCTKAGTSWSTSAANRKILSPPSSRADLHLLLLLLLLDPAEGFQPPNVQSAVCGPLLSMRVKTAGKRERKKREFTSCCKLIGVLGVPYQPCLESGPGASEASDFPSLNCLAESPFPSSRGIHQSQLFSVFWWETV